MRDKIRVTPKALYIGQRETAPKVTPWPPHSKKGPLGQ
jgi:hypothetical protein